ncbi:DNA-binding protein [Paraherbaspirillum soli]|uniref:DNA-binding protein n=1 Tax=Paraherbaspirillum soli TaxID=631222 RepID=A0ABW0M449_9BURK
MTGEQVKRKLRQQGTTMRQWAHEHGFNYILVSRIIRGVQKGNFGKGHQVAVALGMKEESQTVSTHYENA